MPGNLVLRGTPSSLDDGHVPSRLTVRESTTAEVINHLKPFLDGGSALHVLIHGRPGTGKTVVAQRVLQDVAEQTQTKTAYANLWELNTLYGVAESLRAQLRVMFAERSETSHKLMRIRKVLGNHRLVLVLDEVDRVPPKDRDDILYQFTQWPNVALVCLANSREFLMDLEQRVLSRFNPVQIECPAYRPEVVRRAVEIEGGPHLHRIW